MRLIGALDQGTSSTRFILFDESGSIVSQSQKEHKQIMPKPGWVEHDLNDIWNSVKTSVLSIINRQKIDAKNILAIGCGIIDGLELGVNTKSALLVKGIKEIQLLCKAIKCSSDLANGAGFGDIFLTCSSTKSRNNSLGVCLAKGIEADKNLTFEGANSAKIIVLFAQKYNIKLDLCEALSKIINNRYSKEQISSLLIPIILQ